MLVVLETGSYSIALVGLDLIAPKAIISYVDQSGLKFVALLLLQVSRFWDYRHGPSFHAAYSYKETHMLLLEY